VILTEKKELEAERTWLLQEVTANKRSMKELEDNLLFKLSTVQVKKKKKTQKNSI
jgi:dynein heavy chain